MIRGCGAHACRRQVRDEASQRGAIGQQDRDVEQPQHAGVRNRADTAAFVQRDERTRVSGAAEDGEIVIGREDREAQAIAVVLERSPKVGNLEMDRAYPSVDVQLGQRVAFSEIAEVQNGQSRVAGAGGASFLMRLNCLMMTNTASATIRKLIMSLTSCP